MLNTFLQLYNIEKCFLLIHVYIILNIYHDFLFKI